MKRTDLELQHRAEQFLFAEARLLDEGRYEAWLDLFTDDSLYWMPVRENRDPRDMPAGEPGELPIFEEDKAYLKARVARLRTGLAHAETPPSRTRRFVGNVEILEAGPAEATVASNVAVFQSRLEQTENWFVGHRRDVIVTTEKNWRIRRRTIVLDHAVLPRSLSIFF